MKKNILAIIVVILISTYFIFDNSIKYNTSLNQEDVIEFFDKHEQLFMAIKEKLESSGLQYVQIFGYKEEAVFESYYEKDKDNTVQINDEELKLLCKKYFSLVSREGFPKGCIIYRNDGTLHAGNGKIIFSFFYPTSKKSAVDTGVMFIGDQDDYYKEIKESNMHIELREKWFYYFYGLV